MNNLLEGSFLAEYYNGVSNGMTGIYRIGRKGHSDYVVFDILDQTETNYTCPTSVDFNEVKLSDDKHCMYPISYEDVKKHIFDVERQDMIDFIMTVPHGISGVKTGKELEHWQNIEPNMLAQTYSRWKAKYSDNFDIWNPNRDTKVIIVRVLDKGKVIYEPIGDFKFGGHTFNKLKIVG